MPVIAECVSVLVRNATVEGRYPGGVAEFAEKCPNATFCTDGTICRVGFMAVPDAIAYVRHLETLGFLPSSSSGSPEIAVLEEATGFVYPCSWVQVARAELEGGHEATVAFLLGSDMSQIVGPPDWKPGETFALTREEVERDYEVVGVKDGVVARRHRQTGQMIYEGRTQIPAPKKWWEFWK